MVDQLQNYGLIRFKTAPDPPHDPPEDPDEPKGSGSG